jgi:hypothetical protein
VALEYAKAVAMVSRFAFELILSMQGAMLAWGNCLSFCLPSPNLG